MFEDQNFGLNSPKSTLLPLHIVYEESLELCGIKAH